MRTVVLIWWLLPSVLVAQDSVRVAQVGTRVRLTYAAPWTDRVAGALVEIGRDSVVLNRQEQPPVRLSRSAIQSLDISVERKPDYLRGAGLGAAIGAAAGGAGVLLLATAAGNCSDQPGATSGWNYCADATAGKVAAVVGVSALLGGIIGTLIAADRPRDRWVPGRLAPFQGGDGLSPTLLIGMGKSAGHDLILGLRLAL